MYLFYIDSFHYLFHPLHQLLFLLSRGIDEAVGNNYTATGRIQCCTAYEGTSHSVTGHLPQPLHFQFLCSVRRQQGVAHAFSYCRLPNAVLRTLYVTAHHGVAFLQQLHRVEYTACIAVQAEVTLTMCITIRQPQETAVGLNCLHVNRPFYADMTHQVSNRPLPALSSFLLPHVSTTGAEQQ